LNWNGWCFAPLNNRTQFQNYFCNYVYEKEELFKTGEIKDSQRGIRKRLETNPGKGLAIDNIFIERFWRTIKY
jgi:hypothetical protein